MVNIVIAVVLVVAIALLVKFYRDSQKQQTVAEVIRYGNLSGLNSFLPEILRMLEVKILAPGGHFAIRYMVLLVAIESYVQLAKKENVFCPKELWLKGFLEAETPVVVTESKEEPVKPIDELRVLFAGSATSFVAECVLNKEANPSEGLCSVVHADGIAGVLSGFVFLSPEGAAEYGPEFEQKLRQALAVAFSTVAENLRGLPKGRAFGGGCC